MSIVLHIVHVLTALGLVVLVLMQQGQGASAGASFGAGASQTVFGGRGSGNFLTRATAVLATVFFVTSLTLAWQARQGTQNPGELLPSLETRKPAESTQGESAPAKQQKQQQPQEPSDVPSAPGGEAPAGESGSAANEVPAPATPAESKKSGSNE